MLRYLHAYSPVLSKLQLCHKVCTGTDLTLSHNLILSCPLGLWGLSRKVCGLISGCLNIPPWQNSLIDVVSNLVSRHFGKMRQNLREHAHYVSINGSPIYMCIYH